MKDFQSFLEETEVARELSTERIVDILNDSNGKKIPIEGLPQEIIQIALNVVRERLYSELELYHNWLREQMGADRS